jgi:hypothetical protein
MKTRNEAVGRGLSPWCVQRRSGVSPLQRSTMDVDHLSLKRRDSASTLGWGLSLRSLRMFALSLFVVAGLALGAGAAPVVGELAVKSVGDSYAEIEVPITDFGDGATPTLTLAEAFAFSGEDRSLAFDGLTVKSTSTGSSSVGSGFSLVLTNGTSLTMANGSKLTNDGGRILLMEGTTFTGFNKYYMKNGSCTLMRDATFLRVESGTAYVNVSAKRSVALQEGQTVTPLISSPGNGISSSVFKAGTLPSNQSSFTTTSTTFGVNVSITPGFMLLIR